MAPGGRPILRTPGGIGCVVALGGRPRLEAPEEPGSTAAETAPLEPVWGVSGADSCNGFVPKFNPELIHDLSTLDFVRSGFSGALLRCGPRSLGDWETTSGEC